jgi:hypothetical protein
LWLPSAMWIFKLNVTTNDVTCATTTISVVITTHNIVMAFCNGIHVWVKYNDGCGLYSRCCSITIAVVVYTIIKIQRG